MEYLKSSTFKTGLIIYLSHAENTLKSRLNFNESQAKYAYKRYTYKKRAYWKRNSLFIFWLLFWSNLTLKISVSNVNFCPQNWSKNWDREIMDRPIST